MKLEARRKKHSSEMPTEEFKKYITGLEVEVLGALFGGTEDKESENYLYLFLEIISRINITNYKRILNTILLEIEGTELSDKIYPLLEAKVKSIDSLDDFFLFTDDEFDKLKKELKVLCIKKILPDNDINPSIEGVQSKANSLIKEGGIEKPELRIIIDNT